MSKLKELYHKEVVPKLMSKFKYKNIWATPKIEKVVVNIGCGDAKADPKLLEAACGELAIITGQRPIVTVAKRSIAGFGIRAGAKIGCKVTLRRKRMYEFLYKLFNVALPRVRDFSGVSGRAFDEQANYSLGIKEQTVFPEIEPDKVQKIRGMDITIVTTAKTKEEAYALLQLLGLPLRAR